MNPELYSNSVFDVKTRHVDFVIRFCNSDYRTHPFLRDKNLSSNQSILQGAFPPMEKT